MKILMMTNTYTPVVGGVEESIRSFSKEFQSKGHQVLIVAPEFKDMPTGEQGVIRIPAIERFNHSDFSVNLPIPGLLARLMKSFQPDIVHSHHPFLIGDIALRLCGQYSIPLVFTYHTMYEDYLHYLPFQNERIRRFVIELSAGYANLTDQVVVPSQSIHTILRSRGVEVPMEIIPTGVDIKEFAAGDGARIRRAMSIPPGAFVVGHLGRLTPEKNLEFLSEAVAAFVQQNNDAHFLVVGKGALEDRIKSIFESRGIIGRLHMTGVLQGRDVVDAYHAMNVFAFSSHTETQGLVLTEAMAAGVPVVAVDAPGAREAVNDQKNGRLIPRMDLGGFVDALNWCFRRTSVEYEWLKGNARASIRNYSTERCAQAMLDIYRLTDSKKHMLCVEKHSVWAGMMHRIKTEWDMAKNIVDASEAALRPQRSEKAKGGQKRVIRLRRRLSRHEWSASLLNLKQSQATEAEPGLVMVQIDGLSRTQLMRALDSGRMPFLKRLMKSQDYKMYPLYTGLPSSTPSVQGELFYGNKQAVPAFAFLDSQSRKILRMYDREAALAIEERMMRQKPDGKDADGAGLLAQGSSYSNVYAGGAGEVHFCAVKIGWDMLWRGVNPFKLALISVTHGYEFLRMAVLAVAETVLAAFDCLYGIVSGENIHKELKFIPTRSFICMLLRELVTLGARMDISRGLPVIHMNFLGYDEQAHRRGPSTKFAHRALNGIDGAIAKIYGQAMRATRRNYDVWVYSDHGQEECESYATKHGISVKEAIRKIYEDLFQGPVALTTDLPKRRTPLSAESDDCHGVESQRARYLDGWMARRVFSLFGVSGRESEMQKSEASDAIVITAIGPTGNIYLPRTLNREERDRFARRLVEEAQVPVVLAPDGPGKVCVWNEDGRYSLPEDAARIIGEDHMYMEEVTQDLIRMCHHPEGGTFTMIGWRPGKRPVTFPFENGAHAGPGTEETNAFALLPSDIISALDEPAFLRTGDLRASALRILGRKAAQDAVLAARPADPQAGNDFAKTRMLKIMTYNVHSCVGVDGKISPERIARIIARHGPDIVAIQELDLKKMRTGGVDQTHIIAKELEMIYHFHSNIQTEEGHYGSAVLSRFPMRLIKAGRLAGLVRRPDLEPRGAIWCEVDLGDAEVQFLNTHFGLRKEERWNQVKDICGPGWLGHPECRRPVILCGDFNALPGSKVCRHIRRTLYDAQTAKEGHQPLATWFSHIPLGRIDHVFISPDVKVMQVEVSRTDLAKKSSDHLPLIVDVHIPRFTYFKKESYEGDF